MPSPRIPHIAETPLPPPDALGAIAQRDTPARPPLVLYDGACGLCQALVRFLLRHDRRGRLTFAPLQGSTARRLLGEEYAARARSLVLLDGRGRHERSRAVLRTLAGMGGAWRLAWLLLAVPRPLRDAVYDAVAARRGRGGAQEAYCLPASAEERGRLLP
ncbi:MAG TPA: DCC1-like thiol-disulfide oxidoreductase family protein [bacterium]|nr:DCC1-like thiol-disulfide oxidoreductase family protein [bacterium]